MMTTIKWLIDLLNEYSGLLTFCAIFVAIWTLWVTKAALNLKCGNKVIGYYNIASSIESSTPYIREVVLQNMKDKEVAIHEIYIRFGKNIYLDLLNKGLYDSYLHILPPLGPLQFKFGPAFRYCNGTETVDMSDLILENSYGKLILVTNTGKIEVKKIKTGWSPHAQYFNNFGIQNIQTYKYYTRSSVFGKDSLSTQAIDYSSYGDRVIYLITLKTKGVESEYRIFDTDKPQVQKFEHVKFTKQSLQSEQALRSFLKSEKKKGNVSFDDIVNVVDFRELIEKDRAEAQKYGSYTPKAENWFEFYICDKLQTIWWNLKFDYENYSKGNISSHYHYWFFKLWKKFKNNRKE